MADTYRIRVDAKLDDRWSVALGGLALHRRDDGTTVLVGPVVDQAALHGVLARIRDLGVPLLSVNRAADVRRRTRPETRPGVTIRTPEGVR